MASTTAQATTSATEVAATETEVNANREEQADNFMDVDDSLGPMILLAPDGNK